MEAQRPHDLSQRLINSSKVTEERTLANELQQRLGTSAFRVALSEGSAEGSNGWSQMLKAVVIKLTGDRKSSQPDLVSALSRLVEEADKCGALFQGHTAQDVVGHILANLFDVRPMYSPESIYSPSCACSPNARQPLRRCPDRGP